jgi:hypothetical protein
MGTVLDFFEVEPLQFFNKDFTGWSRSSMI